MPPGVTSAAFFAITYGGSRSVLVLHVFAVVKVLCGETMDKDYAGTFITALTALDQAIGFRTQKNEA